MTPLWIAQANLALLGSTGAPDGSGGGTPPLETELLWVLTWGIRDTGNNAESGEMGIGGVEGDSGAGAVHMIWPISSHNCEVESVNIMHSVINGGSDVVTYTLEVQGGATAMTGTVGSNTSTGGMTGGPIPIGFADQLAIDWSKPAGSGNGPENVVATMRIRGVVI